MKAKGWVGLRAIRFLLSILVLLGWLSWHNICNTFLLYCTALHWPWFLIGSASNANNTNNANDANNNVNPFESPDDFERRIFGGPSDDSSNAFFRKIDKARSGLGTGSSMSGDGSGFFDDDSLNSLTDGMEGRLKKAATYFEVNPQEIASEDFTYRPDMNFKYSGMTYTPEDLNLKKPGFWKPGKRSEFEVTTKEVLKNADFRNVRFLANFLTEAGIIIKRSKTGISAKAQRKIAREIKTARAFGLLPFTTMGTKSFVFGKTMEDLDHDFELDRDSRLDADDLNDPIAE